MRTVVVTEEAETQLRHQIDYITSQGAPQAARHLQTRVHAFLEGTLAQFPGSGRHLPEFDVFESWIPRTRLVVWYRFTNDELVVLSVWHTSQDRDSAD